MRERVEQLVPHQDHALWLGTFHSTCARLLRQEAHRLGYQRHFTIYDEEDQLALLKAIMDDLGISAAQLHASLVRHRISIVKNALIGPKEFASQATDFVGERVAKIYTEYERRLRANNAMDFDDLITRPIELFEAYPIVLHHYQQRFCYVLVDEYQDTNRAQYLLLKLIASQHRNVCCVGDDDQSIYRWRGADLRNILDFERDYPDCKVFRLDQNYRSTKTILAAANSVVRNNTYRKEKALWTEREPGEKVTLLEVEDAESEAEAVVEKIKREMGRGRRDFRDFAILYRTNAQSRALEEALRRRVIPYVIVGGVRFYERKEIKDILAYLRVIVNPADTVSLRRIINTPPRGVGEASLAKIEAFAEREGILLFDALGRLEEIPDLSERLRSNIQNFHHMIAKYISLRNEFRPEEIATIVVDEIGLRQALKQAGTLEALNRLENVEELLSAIRSFSRSREHATLDAFLQEVSLVTDIDTWDDRANAVTLMTLHSAKGLEFPVVFIVGLEEGLLPISQAFGSREELEEERRLLYVGMTRAKDKLYLSWALTRRRFGELPSGKGAPSRFLKEIDPQHLETENRQRGLERRAYREVEAVEAAHSEPHLFEQRVAAEEGVSQGRRVLDVGSRVEHPVFGIGKVVAKDGVGETMKVTVVFPRHGEKRLMVRHAKLRIL